MKITRIKGGRYLVTDESGVVLHRIESRTLAKFDHIWFIVDPVSPIYKGVKRYPSLHKLLLTEFPFGFTNRDTVIDKMYHKKETYK